MCLNEVNSIQEDLLPAYHSIKIHSEFEEYLITYCDHPSHYWNDHTYKYLRHSLFAEMNNDTCVKYYMAPQAYKVVNTHANEISVWKILSIIIHLRTPHIGGMNGVDQSDLSTLEFKNGEQLDNFHSRILRRQQEIILYGETVYLTRLILKYTKALSKSDKLKAFIAPKMTDLIKLTDNNRKSSVYTGENIHGLYNYLKNIRFPTTLTTSG